jgi:hypothetical protein
MDSMETKPGRNFLWILTLDYDYLIIIISGGTVQTSSFFREVDTRAQVSATMRGVVAHCTNRNRVLFRLVGRFEPAAAGESRLLASIRLKRPGTPFLERGLS